MCYIIACTWYRGGFVPGYLCVTGYSVGVNVVSEPEHRLLSGCVQYYREKRASTS